MLPPLFSLGVLAAVFLNFAACKAAASPLTGPESPPFPVGIGGGGGGGIPVIIGGAADGAGGAAGGLAGGRGGAAGGARKNMHRFSTLKLNLTLLSLILILYIA